MIGPRNGKPFCALYDPEIVKLQMTTVLKFYIGGHKMSYCQRRNRFQNRHKGALNVHGTQNVVLGSLVTFCVAIHVGIVQNIRHFQYQFSSGHKIDSHAFTR